MAQDPKFSIGHYLDAATNDIKDARHCATFTTFVADCADRLLYSNKPTLTSLESGQLDALSKLINHNSNTYKLACMRIPGLEADQSVNTHVNPHLLRLLVASTDHW